MSISDKIKPTDLCEKTEVLKSTDLKSVLNDAAELAQKIMKTKVEKCHPSLDDLEGISGFDYDSPIKIMNDRITTQFEDAVMDAVHSCDIVVDKTELSRALKYDRNQYKKGFQDGRNGKPAQAFWIKTPTSCTCSNCRRSYNIHTMFSITPEYGKLPKYCPDCGYKMR